MVRGYLSIVPKSVPGRAALPASMSPKGLSPGGAKARPRLGTFVAVSRRPWERTAFNQFIFQRTNPTVSARLQVGTPDLLPLPRCAPQEPEHESSPSI